MVLYDLIEREVYPGVVQIIQFRHFLFGVNNQVVNRGLGNVFHRIGVRVHFLEQDFPVAPFGTE